MFKMTIREALAIQAKQVAYYAHLCPGLAEKIAAKTKVDGLDLDTPMDVCDVNALVPRGGDIEQICGLNWSEA